MLLAGAIEKVKSQGEKKLKELRDSAGRRWPSYVLLEELSKLNQKQPIIFGTSTFAVAETNHVILQEYISRRLYEKTVPFEFWDSLKNRERLTKDDELDLYGQQNRLVWVFFTGSHPLLRSYEVPNFSAVGELITAFRVSSTDAFLVSQAQKARCRYFVTEDRALKGLLKGYGKITPMSSQFMLDQLKKPQNATLMQHP